MELKDLMNAYEDLRKKYNALPQFSELNGIFEIEKIDRESGILLRLIRKIMVEKIVNLLGLIELFLAPNNVPRMYLRYLKSVTTEERKILSDMYDRLSKMVIDCMPLELEYSEKSEAEMISKIYSTWNSMKPQTGKFFARMRNPEQKEEGKERSYFG